MEIEIFGLKDIMQILQGRNKKVIEEYIRNQLQEDIATDQITLKEYVDPFRVIRILKHKNKPLEGCLRKNMAYKYIQYAFRHSK